MSVYGTGRGVGVTELLSAGEWPIIVLFALITQLGDVWLLFLIGGVLYVAGDALPRWGIDRRRGLFILALVLTYAGLIGVLKGLFALPRPPGAAEPLGIPWLPSILEVVYVDFSTADGPGFPSGHALGSTMVWGGLALVLGGETDRTWLGVAGVIIGLVSLSRLVLGVHFLVDVLVGAAVGLVALGVLYWITERGTDPERALFIAVAVGVIGLFVGVNFDSVAAIGGPVGGWLVWRGVAESTPAHPANRREALAGFVALLISGGLFGAVYASDPSHVTTFLGTAIAVGGAVGAPLIGERLA